MRRGVERGDETFMLCEYIVLKANISYNQYQLKLYSVLIMRRVKIVRIDCRAHDCFYVRLVAFDRVYRKQKNCVPNRIWTLQTRGYARYISHYGTITNGDVN